MSKSTSKQDTEQSTTQGVEQQPPVLTLDGTNYDFGSLSERAKMLSSDFVRTEQEWSALQHRYRQFVAMEATVVNHLRQEVEKADLEPVITEGELESAETPLLRIDDKSYDANQIPESVRVYVEDLVRNNQERSQLEFRLRQLDAARTAYLSLLRDELQATDAQPLAGQGNDQEEQNAA